MIVDAHVHLFPDRDAPPPARVGRGSGRHRKPVVPHCGREPASAGYGTDVRALSGAARLRRALARHPEAICIVPPLGMDEPAAFEALLDEFPNLYLDTTMAITGYFPDPPDLGRLRPPWWQ